MTIGQSLDRLTTQLNALVQEDAHQRAEHARLGHDYAIERRMFTDFHLAPERLQSELSAVLDRIGAQQITAAAAANNNLAAAAAPDPVVHSKPMTAISEF